MLQSRAVLLVCLAAAGAAACLSSSSSDEPGGRSVDAAADAGFPSSTGGSVGVDSGGNVSSADAADDAPPAFEAGAGGHQGFAILAGGVRAMSSAHILLTTTGQAPGGNSTMQSANHRIVGGVVGGTQQP